MSQFLPEGFQEKQEQESVQVPAHGPEQYLTPEERTFLTRILSFPADFPPKYKSWILDYIAVNGLEIPISQIRGYENTVTRIVDQSVSEAVPLAVDQAVDQAVPIAVQQALTQFQSQIFTHTVSGALQSTGSTSYVDLATPGPTLYSLPSGQYLFWFGAYIDQDADIQSAMSISVNGAYPSDYDAVRAGVDGLSGDQVRTSISRGIAKQLTGGSNTVQAKYRKIVGSSDPSWDSRWIIGLRIGS